jgi:hypothetical protein
MLDRSCGSFRFGDTLPVKAESAGRRGGTHQSSRPIALNLEPDNIEGMTFAKGRDGSELLVTRGRSLAQRCNGKKSTDGLSRKDDARADVLEYTEHFHNPQRRHSTLGYLSPNDFETKVG